METINIITADMGADNDANATNNGLVITNLNTDSMTTLNITSDTLVTIGNAIDAKLNTINAANATAGVSLDLSLVADTGHTTFDEKSLTVNTGAGDDTLANIFNSGAAVHTAVINTGDGNDKITVTGPVGDQVNNSAVDTLTIDAGAGNDTITLGNTTLATQATVSVTLGDGVDTIALIGDATQSGITVTDFVVGSGGDKINLVANTANGFTNNTTVANMASGTLVNGMTIYTGNNAASLSTTDMAAAFASAGLVDANTNGNIGYIFASDGTDGALYEFTDADGNAAIAASELVLLVTFTGISDASGFTADNFTDFS